MTKNLLIVLTMTLIGGLVAASLVGLGDSVAPIAAFGPIYFVARLLILGLLGSLLIWTPPRSREMRQSLAVASAMAFGSVLWLVSVNAVNLLDMMLFMLVSVIFAIEALELEPLDQTTSQPTSS
ncbi:MAG TPA: hypothetical protein VFL81_01620 [Candidatus Saccharimonadales bacterium]|nr:hypothetical protein [Candidatus Saccharimonadales bacterium]